MNLSRPLTLSRRRSRRGGSRRPPGPASLRARAQPARERHRGRRAVLLRRGFVFKAAVTTSVGCPHCGTDQAW